MQQGVGEGRREEVNLSACAMCLQFQFHSTKNKSIMMITFNSPANQAQKMTLIPKVPDAYSDHPKYSILQGIQLELLLGRTRYDRHVHCIDASMPEHEALPSSHKMCLQIEAVIFICSGED